MLVHWFIGSIVHWSMADGLGSWMMVHGSWFMVRGSWMMDDG